MATADGNDVVITEETGVYNDEGMTSLPKHVKRKLGGVEKGDRLEWRHEVDGTITVEVSESDEE